MSNTIYTKYTQQPSETQPSETQEVSDNVSSYIDYFFNREDIDKLFHR